MRSRRTGHATHISSLESWKSPIMLVINVDYITVKDELLAGL